MQPLVPPNPDFIEATKRFLMAMPISQSFGFEITDVAPGRFEITQPFRRELSFREGVFQAGPIGTLADMAAACASVTLVKSRSRAAVS
jgi:acyl-coenzyme A thioesterase PaaI-like protein